MEMPDITNNPYTRSQPPTDLIEKANAYVLSGAHEEERLARVASSKSVDPNAPEIGPSGFHVELPESIPVSGLRGWLREKRIVHSKKVATDSVHSVDISYMAVNNERKIPRSGWPDTFKPEVSVKNPDGSSVKDNDGNVVKKTNIYRPSKFQHRRKSLHASRLVIARAKHGMRRNGILRSYGVDGPADEEGPIESVGVLYGRDGEVKRTGMVADTRSGARSRNAEVPRSASERRHFDRMDLMAGRDKRFMKWYNWRLDRMAEAPHARARAERATKRAVRLTAKQEQAAEAQQAKREIHGRKERIKVSRRTS